MLRIQAFLGTLRVIISLFVFPNVPIYSSAGSDLKILCSVGLRSFRNSLDRFSIIPKKKFGPFGHFSMRFRSIFGPNQGFYRIPVLKIINCISTYACPDYARVQFLSNKTQFYVVVIFYYYVKHYYYVITTT